MSGARRAAAPLGTTTRPSPIGYREAGRPGEVHIFVIALILELRQFCKMSHNATETFAIVLLRVGLFS